MTIDTTYFERCIKTLSLALDLLSSCPPENIEFDMYRSASIKEFELILEQAGKLLRKAIKPYFHSPKEADKLYFKDIFRQALLRDLISEDQCKRWLKYRDNRNTTAHDYGISFAEDTLSLLPHFLIDAKDLVYIIKNQKEY